MVIKSKSLLNENISNSKFVHTLNYSNLSSLESNVKKPYNTVEKISPYLNGTKLQILSQMTEKKIMQKNSTEVTSSFARACKIYKANSDEFRCVKGKSRKVKTLALSKFADPAIPQTVSDMNDTEYLTRVDNNRKYKQRKHRLTKSPSHPHGNKNYEFFNGDLLYRSGPEADLNSLNKNKANNCKIIKTKKKKKGSENIQSSDVWAMLRDMNRFQWISSPPLSDSSVKTIKKKRKYHNNDKDIGVVETCTTEEFSYVSSYDIKSKSQSILSQQSSFDRVTIIDRTADLKNQESIGLNPRSSKKLAFQKKHTKIKQAKKVSHDSAKHLNDVKICELQNKVYDTQNCNNCMVFKKCLSKESLDGSLNRFGSQKTLLDNYDQYIKDMSSKDKCDENILLKPSAYDQCNNSVDANIYRQSNDQLLRDSEQFSRAGSKNIIKARQTIIQNKDKYKNEVPKVSEVLGKNEKESTRDQALITQKNPRVPLRNPKLTQTEIRRRLANLKFPIVILGNDEISSNFHFVPNEFDQFNGMDQKIWPYMMEWSDDLTINKSLINRTQSSPSTKCQYKSDYTPNDNVCNVFDKDITLRNKTNMNKESKLINEINVDHNTSSIKSQKGKVLNQFKHKLLGLISNKGQKGLIKENDGLKDIRYQVNCNNDFKNSKNDIIGNSKTLDSFTRQPEKKYTWSKRKWTSDFIDNIIKKMKKGLYYTHNSEDTKQVQNNETESSVKAVTECEYVKEETVLENIDDSIPGFENTHNVAPFIVEVKMLTRTQISIHHCLTNVMLQFDIIIPPVVETNSSLSLSSFTPIAHEDKTMIYKCKSSLLNAILPAQLCSVLPKLINQINNAHKSIHKIPSKDTNIPSSFIPKTKLTLRNTAERLTEGSFFKITPVDVIPKYVKNKNLFSLDHNSLKKYMKLLPTIQMGVPFVPMNKCINLVISKYHIDDCVVSLISNKPVINYCKALVPYVPCYAMNTLPNSNLKLLLDNNHIQNNLLGVINFMINIKNSHEISSSESYHYLNKLNDLRPNVTKNITLNVSIINQPLELFYGSNISNYGCIEYDQNYLSNRSMIGFSKTAEQNRLKNNKSRYQHVRKQLKKTFKTHKKCKSMTSMTKENDRTLLNKIVTLEDFVQTLGCCKQLTTVLRGYTEKKILTSITEMKCWIKEISQAQALLVLLLANKKETKNLKRFRPMLLQGIAVNRITTAIELDMEIEVFEKENICISQNEGISLLSTSNGYNLLDELYWIAKTTASDYQKPFDDSSKKLLKSLLEKRKKLNPSYLRVMARYVGLGLLKPRRNYL